MHLSETKMQQNQGQLFCFQITLFIENIEFNIHALGRGFGTVKLQFKD